MPYFSSLSNNPTFLLTASCAKNITYCHLSSAYGIDENDSTYVMTNIFSIHWVNHGILLSVAFQQSNILCVLVSNAVKGIKARIER